MLLSNKLELEFIKEAIDRDFDIYMISKEKGNYFNTNILDEASKEFKAKSVVYYFGNRWYVLFKKDEAPYEAFKATLAKEDAESIITKIDVFAPPKSERSIYSHVLAQLLFNILKVPSRKDMTFSNISGKLYYFKRKIINSNSIYNSFYAIRISLTTNKCLKLEVKTFSNKKEVKNYEKRTKYIFDAKSGQFRRKLKGDKVPESEVYIENSPFPTKKNTVDYLRFKNYNQFENCRVAVYAEFMNDVANVLNSYIKIKFIENNDYNTFSNNDKEFENKDYSLFLKKRGICIIDEIEDDDSKRLMEQIKLELLKSYQVECDCNQYRDKAYVIRIIHNKDYYEDDNDPHKSSDKFNIVQHVTVEDFKTKEKSQLNIMVRKIIQELIVKGDLYDKKISTVNWNIWNPIKFVKVRKFTIDDERKNNKKNSYCIYYRMTIYPDGTFDIDSYNSRQYTPDEEWDFIEKAYEAYSKIGQYREVEGMVYYNYENINVILKTDLRTLPNLFKLKEVLKLSDRSKAVPLTILKEALEEFKTIKGYSDKEEINILTQYLNDWKEETITIGAIWDIKEITIKKKILKEFNRYLYQEKGILLHPTPKDKEYREDYFNSILGIKYFYENDKFYYFVGLKDKDLKLTVPRACIIREVVSTNNKIIFEDILPLLEVEFVRNGPNTVLPFPFKYLNEVILTAENN